MRSFIIFAHHQVGILLGCSDRKEDEMDGTCGKHRGEEILVRKSDKLKTQRCIGRIILKFTCKKERTRSDTYKQARSYALAYTLIQISNIYCFFHGNNDSRTRSILRYTYIVSLVLYQIFSLINKRWEEKQDSKGKIIVVHL
jgi:hypothetical protein